jgi:hypothetical protein
MGWRERKSTSIADIGFESAVHRQSAPIGVVSNEQRRFLVIVFRSNCFSHTRASAIGAHDDLSALDGGVALLRAALDADRTSVLDQDFLDGEAFADLRAGLSCGVDEQLVEYRAPRAVRDRCFPSAGRANNREGTKVEGVGVDRRASGRRQAIEEAPLCEGSCAKGV